MLYIYMYVYTVNTLQAVQIAQKFVELYSCFGLQISNFANRMDCNGGKINVNRIEADRRIRLYTNTVHFW